MSRGLLPSGLRNLDALTGSGLTGHALQEGVASAYKTLDAIDTQMLRSGSGRLTTLVELANFSSILGNLLAGSLVRVCGGVFERAGPHKYQDLRAVPGHAACNVEIKVSLEKNLPKGHLAKPGAYLTCRYVLGDHTGRYIRGERGDVAWIWELRFGHLVEAHFNLSNTPGDSGKTAVVNRDGLVALRVVYLDEERCPYGARSRHRRG